MSTDAETAKRRGSRKRGSSSRRPRAAVPPVQPVARSRTALCALLGASAVLYAVMAFGAIADEYRQNAIHLTMVAAVICLVLLPRRRWYPPINKVLFLCLGFLLAYGFFLVANAKAEHSLILRDFDHLDSMLEWAPGSVARSTSMRAMVEFSAVLLAMLAALRSTESECWRFVVGLLATAGALVALVGMTHHVLGAEAVWWIEDKSQPTTAFAPYIYNANAGAFMNLCFPLSFALALVNLGKMQRSGLLWAIACVITAAGIISCASKGATALFAVSLALLLFINRGRLIALVKLGFGGRQRKVEHIALAVVLLSLFLVLAGLGGQMAVERWSFFLEQTKTEQGSGSVNSRAKVAKIMTQMSAPDEGGWHGFGPGTFRHLFPHFTLDPENQVPGRWDQGHSDPLQTLVEWGYVGTAAWLGIGLGALGCGFGLLKRKRLPPKKVPQSDGEDPSTADNALTDPTRKKKPPAVRRAPALVSPSEASLVRGVIIALVITGVHSCFDFPLSVYSIHLAALLLCAVLWGLWAVRRKEARSRSVARKKGKAKPKPKPAAA